MRNDGFTDLKCAVKNEILIYENTRCAHERIDALVLNAVIIALSGYFSRTTPAVGMHPTVNAL